MLPGLGCPFCSPPQDQCESATSRSSICISRARVASASATRGGVYTGRLTSLVKVFTDEGLTGLVSVYSHPDVSRTIIESHLRPALFGGGSA